MKNYFLKSNDIQRGESISNPNVTSRSFLCGVVFILAINTVLSPVIARAESMPAVQTNTASMTHEQRMSLFQQAVSNDLVGQHAEARKIYDALKNSDISANIAVPSAVNLVALDRFSEARRAFNALAKSANTRDRDYARLWQLWLTARRGTANPQQLEKSLRAMAGGLQATASYQQEIINLYAGKSSVDAVFAAVSAMPDASELQRTDALTEATFFTSGYLRYVKHDSPAAKDLLQKKSHQLSSVSLEIPLITREKAAL